MGLSLIAPGACDAAMLQCEICAETLVETLLGKKEAEPNQKENNEREWQPSYWSCLLYPPCITTAHRAVVSYTVRLPFPIGIAPHNRSPVVPCQRWPPYQSCTTILSSTLCTTRLHSVHNPVDAKRQSPTHSVTLVHQR